MNNNTLYFLYNIAKELNLKWNITFFTIENKSKSYFGVNISDKDNKDCTLDFKDCTLDFISAVQEELTDMLNNNQIEEERKSSIIRILAEILTMKWDRKIKIDNKIYIY